MFNIDAQLAAWTPRMRSVLRIVTALLFLAHGTTKFFGFPGTAPARMVLYPIIIGGVLELVGGALLLAGFYTRLVAFIVAGEMAVAYWTAHFPRAPYPITNGGEAAILFCFVFLYLAFAGPGPWSVDAKRG